MVTSRLTDEHRAVLYDAETAWAVDDDFFLALVNEQPGSRMLDLGCGTGRLTVAIANSGHQVVGIDPNSGSLAAARSKSADAVTWIAGVLVSDDRSPQSWPRIV